MRTFTFDQWIRSTGSYAWHWYAFRPASEGSSHKSLNSTFINYYLLHTDLSSYNLPITRYYINQPWSYIPPPSLYSPLPLSSALETQRTIIFAAAWSCSSSRIQWVITLLCFSHRHIFPCTHNSSDHWFSYVLFVNLWFICHIGILPIPPTSADNIVRVWRLVIVHAWRRDFYHSDHDGMWSAQWWSMHFWCGLLQRM